MATLGLLKPKKIFFHKHEITDSYGKFLIEPLARGYGYTLGNSLRRVLLSSIEGSAIVAIRLENIYHEFSTIPGIAEDSTEIILNLKNVRFKLFSDGAKTMIIDKTEAGPVRAKDIKSDPDFEIINPDCHICTLDENAKFRLEMIAKHGLGYATSEENIDDDLDKGFIPIDSIFSPIKNVAYKVEPTRLGKSINYDRLVMQITTDGSITPEVALDRSAKKLREYLMPFLISYESPAEIKKSVDKELEKRLEFLNKDVSELELSVRSAHCLKNANIKTIKDLVFKSETDMIKTKNFGKKSLNEIKQILANMGLRLGMNHEDLDLDTVSRPDKNI